MRLGFWNRLAIVATGLGLLIAPVTIQTIIANDLHKSRMAFYGLCYEAATKRLEEAIEANAKDTFAADVARCDADLTNDKHSPFTWRQWFELAQGTLAFAAILYVLFGIVGIIGRWVWRGRDVKKNTD